MLEDAILTVGLLIVVAKLAEGVFRRFRLNSIVAYMATGVLLGPVLGFVELTGHLHVFLTLGIFLYFFLIGLDEIDVTAFMAAIRGRFFVAALIGVIIPLLASLLVTMNLFYDFGLQLDFDGALALAGVLSLTSLGVLAKVLIDTDRLREPIGIELFTTALIAELLMLLLVGLTIGEHSHDLSWMGVLILLGQIAAFTIVTWVLAGQVIPRLIEILERLLRVPQLSFGLILGILLVAVVCAERLGLHGSLGALLLGVALSRLPHQVQRDIIPSLKSIADGFFVPLFFSSAGLHLSLSFTELPGLTIAALAVIPLIGKFAGASLGALVARLDSPFTIATGLMAKGVAEIAVLLVLLEHDVIGQAVFSLFVLLMLAYILFAPPIISFAVSRARPHGRFKPPQPLPPNLLRFALDDITIGEVIDRTHAHPGPDLTVREFADEWLASNQHDYVVAEGGELVGVVSLAMLRYLPKHSWFDTPLRKIARKTELNTWPDEHVEDALQRMTENALTVLPVLEGESQEFVGAITSQEILELIMAEARGGH
ncbi:MAG: cation:proton antiporter [Nitrospinae bacterium]|nr:cation:proton antiporter [Nitrospinota bacterium]